MRRSVAVLCLVSALALARVDVSISQPTQGTCNATLAIRNCALDPAVAPSGRDQWPAGLISDVSAPIFGQTAEYSLFADHVAFLIHQLFRDADRKEAHVYDRPGSPGECYFPLLYYTCASAYHECREDGNVTVRVERVVATDANGVAVTESVMEPLKVPRYPCASFCEDATLQTCKDELVDAVNDSLFGLPTLHHYLDNITDWFNCTKLAERSGYSRDDKDSVCLARPPAPSPPPAPPPPEAPEAPPAPYVLSAGRRGARGAGLPGVACAAAAFAAWALAGGRGGGAGDDEAWG
jgi:hypothetical protein